MILSHTISNDIVGVGVDGVDNFILPEPANVVMLNEDVSGFTGNCRGDGEVDGRDVILFDGSWFGLWETKVGGKLSEVDTCLGATSESDVLCFMWTSC